ncbi:MAG TPA: class I SAM-dependent methyltransferase [Roseiflexaceae bacterium]|nr:class I SAM-dependent methyltransferase [Roseiflexaceae bacterium]HMP39174.1 class I SAM-dependent methyltransferase [Roseiflexaceae bacterium]
MTQTLPQQRYSFDRIAYAYDDFSSHPAEVAAQIGPAIAMASGHNALVLELGIGTARIAQPVADAGCRVVGIDLAIEMLRKAQQKGFERLVRGNLLQLPLRDSSVDAVLVVHVLHHIPDWRAALAEAMRVLRPGGVLIQGNDWLDPQSCVRRMRGVLRQAVIDLKPSLKPPGAGAAFTQALAHLGGDGGHEVIAASWYNRISPADLLARMASRVHQETWPLDDQLLAAALDRVRGFAEQEYADLNTEQEFERRFVLTITRKAFA